MKNEHQMRYNFLLWKCLALSQWSQTEITEESHKRVTEDRESQKSHTTVTQGSHNSDTTVTEDREELQRVTQQSHKRVTGQSRLLQVAPFHPR